jgi:hypothetical protein
MNSPMISSIGLPPDLHAERIVTEMLRWLHAEHKRQHERLLACAGGILDVRTMGTPKGQHRAAARLKKATNDIALDIRLLPAKRGKFTLTLVDWSIWDPIAGVLAEDGPMPPIACLAGVLTVFTGANHRPEVKVVTPLVVTRHACVRLAQRAGIRTVDDLIVAMRELWWATSALIYGLAPDRWLSPPNNGWFLPIKTVDGETLAMAVLDRDRDAGERLVVKTVLAGDMVVSEMLVPTRQAIDEAMARRNEICEVAVQRPGHKGGSAVL